MAGGGGASSKLRLFYFFEKFIDEDGFAPPEVCKCCY
jgi:hypothetical protein